MIPSQLPHLDMVRLAPAAVLHNYTQGGLKTDFRTASGTKLRFAAMHNFAQPLVRSSAAACRTVGGRNLEIYSFRPLLRLADRAGRTSTRSAQTG
jgi:hypothetical protein